MNSIVNSNTKVNLSTNEKKIFKGEVTPNWCPGCGDFGLLSATTKALGNLGYQPHEVVIVSGIGCSSNFPHFITAYGFHAIHGRALPVALGIQLSNPELKIIVVGGDGDGYGIGVGHLIHAFRRNLNMAYLVMNNQIYGLTLGQASPTSALEHITLTSPEGVDEAPINPISLALGAGASFVGRGFSGDPKHLENLIKKAILHEGFGFIDVLSPCVTYNKLNTYSWFKERIYKLEEINHDNNDLSKAFSKSQEWDNNIPIGLFYQKRRPTLLESDPVSSTINVSKKPLGFKYANITEEEVFTDFR